MAQNELDAFFGRAAALLSEADHCGRDGPPRRIAATIHALSVAQLEGIRLAIATTVALPQRERLMEVARTLGRSAGGLSHELRRVALTLRSARLAS